MCNGDLGMYRVLPWSLPPILGGSAGGFVTDPGQGDPLAQAIISLIKPDKATVTQSVSLSNSGNSGSYSATVTVKVILEATYANKDLIKSISSDFSAGTVSPTFTYKQMGMGNARSYTYSVVPKLASFKVNDDSIELILKGTASGSISAASPTLDSAPSSTVSYTLSTVNIHSLDGEIIQTLEV